MTMLMAAFRNFANARKKDEGKKGIKSNTRNNGMRRIQYNNAAFSVNFL